ncbi:MAG: isochorismatase family protein [Actinomycetes bacterium]
MPGVHRVDAGSELKEAHQATDAPAMDYLEQVRPYNHDRRPSPASAALLVIDMQEFFSDIAQAIVPAIGRLVAAARTAGCPVIFTRHGHRDLLVDGGALAAWWGEDLAMVGTPAWQIISGLAPRPGDPVIDKHHYSAFFGTGLDLVLEPLPVTDLIICGVMTNCCCETTARDAFMRDYRVFVAADGTAATNTDLHVSSLKGMAYACASIVAVDDLVETLTSNDSG